MAEEPAFPRKLATAFYFFLILLGILFYVSWGIIYGTWNLADPEAIGVYALTVVLIGFGVTGYFLYRKPLPKPERPGQ
jgi:hypothetical protein